MHLGYNSDWYISGQDKITLMTGAPFNPQGEHCARIYESADRYFLGLPGQALGSGRIKVLLRMGSDSSKQGVAVSCPASAEMPDILNDFHAYCVWITVPNLVIDRFSDVNTESAIESADLTLVKDTWYLLDVTYEKSGTKISILANLYTADGVTLLGSVSCNNDDHAIEAHNNVGIIQDDGRYPCYYDHFRLYTV
jgi:hypothetical protein